MHVCVVIVRQKLRHFSTWLSKWNSPIKLLWKKMKLWLATKFAAVCFFFLGWVELKFGPRLWALSSPTQPGPDFGWPDPSLNLNNCPYLANTGIWLPKSPGWPWPGPKKFQPEPDSGQKKVAWPSPHLLFPSCFELKYCWWNEWEKGEHHESLHVEVHCGWSKCQLHLIK